MNSINRYELYVLDDDEKPIEVTEDTKIPNAATIKIVKQDHTLANMLRSQLLAQPSVLFAGYKVPHPLQPYFILKVQTDGSRTPATAIEEAAGALIVSLVSLEEKFSREFSFKELDRPTDVDGVGSSGLGGLGGSGRDGGLGGGGGAYGEDATWSGRDYLDL